MHICWLIIIITANVYSALTTMLIVYCLISCIPCNKLWSRCFYDPHFTEQETEAQRSHSNLPKVIWPWLNQDYWVWTHRGKPLDTHTHITYMWTRYWRRSSRGHHHQLTPKLDRGNWRLLTPSPVLGRYTRPTVPTVAAVPRMHPWESKVLLRPSGLNMRLNSIKASI